MAQMCTTISTISASHLLQNKTHSDLQTTNGVIITKVQEQDHANPLADQPPRSSQSNHLHHQPNHLRLINLTTCAQSTQPPLRPTSSPVKVSQTISLQVMITLPPRPSISPPSLTGPLAAQPSTSPFHGKKIPEQGSGPSGTRARGGRWSHTHQDVRSSRRTPTLSLDRLPLLGTRWLGKPTAPLFIHRPQPLFLIQPPPTPPLFCPLQIFPTLK